MRRSVLVMSMLSRSSILGVIVLVACGCKREKPAPRPPPGAHPTSPAPAAIAKDVIPRASGPIKIDGEWDESDWPQRALRLQFIGSDGQLARPYSEVRFIYDDANLYVGLYAADQNILTASDAFDLIVGPVSLRIDPKGKLTPARDDVKVGIDSDGTVDHPGDDDEEWKLEIAIPLAATDLAPGKHVDVKAARCDTPRDGIERCGSWSGSLTLDK